MFYETPCILKIKLQMSDLLKFRQQLNKLGKGKVAKKKDY